MDRLRARARTVARVLLARENADAVFLALLTAADYAVDAVRPRADWLVLFPDAELSHAFADPERVSDNELYIYGVFVPLGLLVVLALLGQKAGKGRWQTLFADAAFGLWASVAVTLFVTHLLKVAGVGERKARSQLSLVARPSHQKLVVARPRPDFYSRCDPRPDALPELEVAGTRWFAQAALCRTPLDSPRMVDGRKSFPSGHSSLAFAGLAFFAVHTARVFVTGRCPPALAPTAVAFALAVLPVLAAAYIAGSRILDHRHHWQDVLAGSIIGCAGAAFGVWYARARSVLRGDEEQPDAARLDEDMDDASSARELVGVV